MRRRESAGILVTAMACVFLAGMVWAQDAQKGSAKSPAKPSTSPTLTAAEILHRAVGRAKESEQRWKREKFLYRLSNLVEKLDGNGQLSERDERVYEVVEVDGGLYTRLMQRNGNALEGNDLRDEQKREKKWREAGGRDLGERDEKNRDGGGYGVRFGEELVSKYRVQLVEEATVAGQPAWVIAFEPTGGDLPVRRRVDRVLNKIAGKLWINMKDYEISRAEAHLTERVRMVGGLVASINDFTLKLEQRPLDATTWVPAHMDLYIDGRIMLTSLHQRIKTTWQEYRRAGATVADGRP